MVSGSDAPRLSFLEPVDAMSPSTNYSTDADGSTAPNRQRPEEGNIAPVAGHKTYY